MELRLAWNSLWNQAGVEPQNSCLSYPCTVTMSVTHHAQIKDHFFPMGACDLVINPPVYPPSFLPFFLCFFGAAEVSRQSSYVL